MKAKTVFALVVLIALCAFALNQVRANATNLTNNANTNKRSITMKSYVSIFEIPATDISRAIEFYQAILGIRIEKMEMPGMQMGILPFEEQIVTGVIIQADGYVPSPDGVTIYLNGGNDLQTILDKVEKHEGKILVPKTTHADDSGYFALFLDSEGNKMGLHSPN